MLITDVREATVSLRSPMANAYVNFSEMTASIVAVITDVMREGRPIIGYGFNSNGRYGVGGLLRERFIPRLLRAPADTLLDPVGGLLDPSRVWDVLMSNEKPGGHGERAVAVGTLDMAIWDAVAKIEEVPLWKLLADRFNDSQADTRVYVYAAGGYYAPEKTTADLQREVRGYLDAGYESVKIKVGGVPLASDLARIEAVLEVVGSGGRLAVDANARFDTETALEFADAIASYDLKWFEEPGDPHDFSLMAEVSRRYPGRLATGENLFAMVEARNLIRYAGLDPRRDLLQFDPVLSYGIVEYLRTLSMLREAGWSPRHCIPHGGHQLALHAAAGLGLMGNEAYPGVFAPFGGFADDSPVEDGYMSLTEAPGIGIELKADLYQTFRQSLG